MKLDLTFITGKYAMNVYFLRGHLNLHFFALMDDYFKAERLLDRQISKCKLFPWPLVIAICFSEPQDTQKDGDSEITHKAG